MLIGGNIGVDATNSLIAVRDSLFAASPIVSQAAGALMVTAIWQGTVVAGFLAICLKLASRISASLRFAVWTAGFLAVVTLPFLPLFLHSASSPATSSAVRLAASAPGALLQLDIR